MVVNKWGGLKVCTSVNDASIIIWSNIISRTGWILFVYKFLAFSSIIQCPFTLLNPFIISIFSNENFIVNLKNSKFSTWKKNAINFEHRDPFHKSLKCSIELSFCCSCSFFLIKKVFIVKGKMFSVVHSSLVLLNYKFRST